MRPAPWINSRNQDAPEKLSDNMPWISRSARAGLLIAHRWESQCGSNALARGDDIDVGPQLPTPGEPNDPKWDVDEKDQGRP